METIFFPIKFILAFLGVYLLLGITLSIFATLITKPFSRIDLRDRKSRIVKLIGWTVLIIAFTGAAFLMGPIFDYSLPFPPRESKIIEHEAALERIQAFDREVSRIQNTLSHLDSLTISQLKDELTHAMQFLESLQIETIQQEKIVAVLRKQVKKENDRVNQAKIKADNMSKLTKEQLEAIKLLLTTDMRREQAKAFWIGVLTSFVIGVLASLLSAGLLRLMWRRKT